ncbi:probable E3 ubiquitin-protein ligase bre1 [Vanessa atalanta]|uniref:probable E3 ubiquitin-protein ligase bre1 n=1 Tax=Vanessa atalanta TaxID=42275 RepID=UPI001FCD9564|nr:probable E3 ubiquitin-protein ligase bre1 [Vanessa atalanta]
MRKRVKKIKQENEITKSHQLLQKKRKRKLTDRTQFSLLLDERKPDNFKPLSSCSKSDMFYDLYGNFNSLSTSLNHTLPERENTTCKKLPLRIEGDVIILDSDDEAEISPNKSKQDNTVSYTSHLPSLKNNENDNGHEDTSDDEFSIYNESTSNINNVFNDQASTANSHDIKTSLYTEPVEFHNPHDFCPIPSTSKDDETILKNEERFKEYISLCISNRKATHSPEIKKECCEPMITDETDTQQLIEKKESEDDDTNTPKINCPTLIDTIDLSYVDDVIAENDSILNRIRNRHSRIGKLIEVLKTEPEDITAVLNNSSNNEVTVPVNDGTTKMELSDLSTPPSRINEVSYSIENIDTSQNNPHTNYDMPQESSIEQTNSLSRDIELHIPNSGVTNESVQLQSQMLNVLPINIPVDQITNSISQSSNSQISNSDENFITNDNVTITCNCSQQRRIKSLSQTSNTVSPSEKESSNQNSEQNVNQEEKKTSFISARCPICMESLAEKVIASTLCGHLFCMPCIKAALKYPPKKCPTCRQKITGIGYHQIFLF